MPLINDLPRPRPKQAENVCLELSAHLHMPALDEFDEAAWERALKTHLEKLAGMDVAEIRVIDVGATVTRIIEALEVEFPLDGFQVVDLRSSKSDEPSWLDEFANRASRE